MSELIGSSRAFLPWSRSGPLSPRRRTTWLLALVGVAAVFSLGLAVAQQPHTTWLRGSVHAVEEDVLSALWPLAQSFDSPMGYGYTGDNPYPHLIQGPYGGTAFYPPGYPLLLWMLAGVTGDPHRASQIIGGFAAVLMMGATYWLGLGWTGKRGVALLAAAMLATSSVYLVLAYVASTDLLAGALVTAAVAGGVWLTRHPTQRRWVVLAALFLGLAFLVRRQTAVMLLPLMAMVLASSWGRWREGIRRLVLFLGVAALVALPDLLVQVRLHGTPLYSAHGKNIWNAVINDYDWPAWHEVPNSVSAVAVVAQAPTGVLENWLSNVLHYAETLWLGPATFLVLPGLVLLWRRPPLRPQTVAALAAAVVVVVIASISERGDRHALILVPTLAVIAAAGIWYGVGARWRLRGAALFVAAGLLVATAHAWHTVRDELQVPYLDQVTEALQSDGATREDAVTSFGSSHYAFYADLGFEPLPGDVVSWSDLRAFMEQEGVDYYIARRAELHDHRLVESLEPDAAPAWLAPVWVAPPGSEASRIAVYRFDEEASP